MDLKKVKKLLSLLLILNFQLFANELTIIDVRTPEEFMSGHIEGSKNIEWQEISSIENIIDKNKKIFLYCRSGNRSQKATNILLSIGYKDVTNLGSLKEASELLNKKIIK
jgi:phage shock protein E|tara:strand:+ start:525 stop:854 length:330 start_codon:yes stop_codon:yes gene_type:complete